MKQVLMLVMIWSYVYVETNPDTRRILMMFMKTRRNNERVCQNPAVFIFRRQASRGYTNKRAVQQMKDSVIREGFNQQITVQQLENAYPDYYLKSHELLQM